MTIVEFFDEVSIENMVSCMTIHPQKIIFIGDKKPMKKQEEVYKSFAKRQGVDAEFEYRSVNKNSIDDIAKVLSNIVETEDDVIFDLTGGEDLVLVAMGIVFERYKSVKKVKMHRFNVRTGVISDCDSDGIIPDITEPTLTVEENIMLYGGLIIPFKDGFGTYCWDLNDDFVSDLKILWGICKRDPGLWNVQTSVLAEMVATCQEDFDSLDVDIEKSYLKSQKSYENYQLKSNVIIDRLIRYGYLENYIEDENRIAFSFKNEQIKICLTKAGTLLEVMVLYFSTLATDKNGDKKYDDYRSGVCIDWDMQNCNTEEEIHSQNEIDVILMKGLTPIFISCKNGHFDVNEFYKLNTVAERFGGSYSKKVLVATYFGGIQDEKIEYLRQRAEDMNIKLIENVHEMEENEFSKVIRNIVS